MSIPMTDEECRRATETLSEKIDRYAQLLVRKGAAIKTGQQLLVQAPVECADFVRRVVRAAYAAGSGPVTVVWDDDVIRRLTFENNELDYSRE